MTTILNKSIEQLENDFWQDPGEFPSGLVKRCYAYRKIPIGSLSCEQLRTLISQDIGTRFLLPIVIEMLEVNPLAEGDFYPGDLLVAILRIEEAIWKTHPELMERYVSLVEKNETLILKELGNKTISQLRKISQP